MLGNDPHFFLKLSRSGDFGGFADFDSSAYAFDSVTTNGVVKLFGQVTGAICSNGNDANSRLDANCRIRARFAVGPEHVIHSNLDPRILINFIATNYLPRPVDLGSKFLVIWRSHTGSIKERAQFIGSRYQVLPKKEYVPSLLAKDP